MWSGSYVAGQNFLTGIKTGYRFIINLKTLAEHS
jgi:hypothetical protein